MAKMSNSLVKQFAKTITQSVPQEKSKSSNALGTLVKEGNIFYAMLDGSTFLTPVSMSMSGEEGDRVLVTIQNHSAIVTSNITAPGATTKYVERVEADLTTFKDVTVKNLLANYIRTDELEAKVGTFGYLKVETAEATYLKVDELEGKVGTFGYLKVSELEGSVGKFGYLTADQASLKYAQIDFANVTGQVVGTSLIKDGAITDAKILGLSANKITAGILDAAKITVTNLNADNITVGTLNGKLIGTGSVNLNKLAEEVPTKEYLDSVQNGLQGQIDKSIQTYTVTAIPLLNNEPAHGWATEEYQKHVGDICYVVNPGGQADGYTYRFEKDGDTYGWSLIKDSQVTEALQKLLNVDGDLSGLKSFQSETSSWITKTDSELSSVKSRTTTIETTYSTKEEAKNLVSDAKKDLENALSTKVESTTFNEVKQTVDTNSAQITQMTKTLEQKADGSAVESLQQTVNTVQQTANENVSKISQVTQSVEKAQSTADDANSKIDNLQIGGRNLLHKTSFEQVVVGNAFTVDGVTYNTYAYGWGGYNGSIGNPTTNYHAYLDPITHHYVFDETNGNDNWKGLIVNNNNGGLFVTDFSGSYIFSATLKATGSGTKLYGGFYYVKKGTSDHHFNSGMFMISNIPDGKEVRLSAKVPLNDDVDLTHGVSFYIYGYNFSGRSKLEMWNPKLEKGTKATDWTPAPEDMATQDSVEKVSSIVNEVKQTADSNYAKITQMNQTIAQKADGSKVTKLEERTSSVEQNLSGFKSEVSSTYTTKTEFENLESTYNSYVQQTDSKIAAKLESSTFNSFQNGEYSNFKKSTNEFIGTSEAWEMRWNKIFNSDNAAEDTYQSYITFQNGEQILGNSKSNIKLHLKNDVIQFEDSNGNALASFDAANIYLGKNSKESTIDLCSGSGKIAGYASDYGDVGIELSGPHYVNLFTEGVEVDSNYVNKSSALLMGDEYVDIFLNDGNGGWSSRIALEQGNIKFLGNSVFLSDVSFSRDATFETSITVKSQITTYQLVANGGVWFNQEVCFANAMWNKLGNDVYFGDQNIAGGFCIYGKTGSPGIYFSNTQGSIFSLTSQWMKFRPGPEDYGCMSLGVTDNMWGLFPDVDNYALNIGTSGHRWRAVYAKNATIQTSDERVKTILGTVSDKYLEFFNKIDPIIFKWNDGDTDTRLRIGLGAQTVERALFESGINPEEYAGLNHDYYDNPGSDGLTDRYSMDYIMYLLIAATQTKKNTYTIKCLESQLQSALCQIEALRNKLHELEMAM